MKDSRISEKTFTGLLIGIAPIIAGYYGLTGRPVGAVLWVLIGLFHVFIFLKREIYDDW